MLLRLRKHDKNVSAVTASHEEEEIKLKRDVLGQFILPEKSEKLLTEDVVREFIKVTGKAIKDQHVISGLKHKK